MEKPAQKEELFTEEDRIQEDLEAKKSLIQPSLDEQVKFINRKKAASIGFPDFHLYQAVEENLIGLRLFEEAERRQQGKPTPESVFQLAKSDPLI